MSRVIAAKPLALLLACLCLLCCRPVHAVIIYGGDAGQNLTAPTGAFANSGWQDEGLWQGGAGTAIAPNFFLTAKHLGGSVGDTFTQNGSAYTVTAMYSDPAGSDLELVQVKQTFTNYAQLYTDTNEEGKILAVFGAGTSRGSAVTGPLGEQGYLWSGGPSGQLSWGASQVTGIYTFNSGPSGDFISGTFSSTQSIDGQTSSTLSAGDSGGGVFIDDNGVWKLAGVNYAVDGPYSLDSSFTNAFDGAMYDTRGLYNGSASDYNYTSATLTEPVGQNWYATRVSTNSAFINAIVDVPEPGSLALIAVGLLVIGAATRAMKSPRAIHSEA